VFGVGAQLNQKDVGIYHLLRRGSSRNLKTKRREKGGRQKLESRGEDRSSPNEKLMDSFAELKQSDAFKMGCGDKRKGYL